MTAVRRPGNLNKGPYGIFDELTEMALDEAIKKAVPVDDEQIGYIGNEPVFVLCQYLQGVNLPEGTVLSDLRPFAKQWYDLSADMLVDADGEILSFGDVWAQVLEVWQKIKYAKGNALENAKIRAGNATYTIPELQWCEDGHILYLAKVCYELSRPDGKFFISGEDAGGILGKTQKTGRASLKMFEASKIIVCTQKGHSGKASEYKYIGKPVFEATSADSFEHRKQKMIDDLQRAESEDNTSEDD